MSKIYSFDEKIQAVKLFQKNGSKAEVSRFLGIPQSLIYTWVTQYYYGGPSALLPKERNQTYDERMKIAIVEDIINKQLSLHKASFIFGISQESLTRWVQGVKEGGFTTLFGNIPKNITIGMKKKKDEPKTELEMLREENMRLRAELDLIKKVDALVAKRCKRTIKSEQKPSKN